MIIVSCTAAVGTRTMKRTRVKRNEGILCRRWTRTPARRQDRAQDRPHARHADLHLEERQSRRRKTVTPTTRSVKRCPGVLNSANPEVPNRPAARTFQF